MSVTIDTILEMIDKMPEPPKASIQAVNMLEDPDVPISKVSQFITMDESLTAKLLKLSNSAHYGYSGKVTTVKEALMRIGTNIVKCSLYSSMLESANFKQSPFFIELWKSSLFTAFVSKDVGERLEHPRPDVCFTAGLLCDIGQLLMNEFSTQVYTSLVKEVLRGGHDLIQAEQQVFGFSHIDVGGRIAELWHLPVIYQNVIQYHHNPSMAHGKVLPADFKLITSIHVANSLSPLFTDQSGRAINMDAVQDTGVTISRDILIKALVPKFPSYYRDITKITQSMFGRT